MSFVITYVMWFFLYVGEGKTGRQREGEGKTRVCVRVRVRSLKRNSTESKKNSTDIREHKLVIRKCFHLANVMIANKHSLIYIYIYIYMCVCEGHKE